MRFGKVPPAFCNGQRLYVSGTEKKCRIKIYSSDKKVLYCDHVHKVEDLTRYYMSSATGACPKCEYAIVKSPRLKKIGQWWDWDPLDFLNPREDEDDEEEEEESPENIEARNEYMKKLTDVLYEYLSSGSTLKWQIFFKDQFSKLYSMPKEHIGKGGQGSVYKVKENAPPFKTFAFKEVCVSDTETKGFGEIKECLNKVNLEISIMQKISDLGCLHNLACLRGIQIVLDFYSPGKTVWIYLVQDLIAGVNLNDLTRPLSKVEFENLAYSLFEALAYLHGIGFAHGDIYSPNIMAIPGLKNEFVEYRLIDFGFSIDHLHKWGNVYPLEVVKKEDVRQAINILIMMISYYHNFGSSDLFLLMTRNRDYFLKAAKDYDPDIIDVIDAIRFNDEKMNAMEILKKLNPDKAKQVTRDLQIAREK